MEQTSKTLKVLLGILLVFFIATAVFVLSRQRGIQKASIVVTPPPTSQNQTEVPVTQTTTQASVIPLSEAQTQIKAIQDQVNAGTITSEEAQKKLEALSTQVAPPAIPADVLKQMDTKQGQ